MTLKNSEKSRNSLVVVAVATALFGFITQFVGLRAMHATITVIQLGAVLFMTALRSFGHMQQEKTNDIKSPKQVDGHELDWLAKELNRCETWEVVTGFNEYPPPEEHSNLAIDVMKSRARLAILQKDWELENRERIGGLQSAIEGTMNYAFSGMKIKDDLKGEGEFRWSLPVKVKLRDSESVLLIALSLKRGKDGNGSWELWSAGVSELEAVLCL